MTVSPAGLARVSNIMRSNSSLAQIQRTSVSLLEVQNQLSTGRAINRGSDDPVRAAAIGALDTRLAQSTQRSRNISHASSVLGSLDSSMGEVTDLVRQASSVASSQIGITSDATTRAQQAVVIDSLIRQLQTVTNRQTAGLYLFGGSTATSAPLEMINGGFRYIGQGAGIHTDIGPGDSIPVTIGGDNAIGETSSRLRSTRDLNARLTPTTPLADLRGANGAGIRLGVVALQFNAGPTLQVDLAGAASADDINTKLTVAIRQYETDNSVTILGPGGVSISGSGVNIDVPVGQLTFANLSSSTAAADLGLTQAPFNSTNTSGGDLDSKLTLQSTIASLGGITPPLGVIRLRSTQGSASVIRDIDLSSAVTIDDIRSRIEAAGLGVRVRVNDQQRGLSIVSEVAGRRLSIEEVPGNNSTASQLGIRSLDTGTRLADFNNGRSIGIVDNVADPITGAISPALNSDFRVTLGNGQAFDVDLRPQDTVSVQTVLDRINAAFTAAIGQPPVNAAAPALAAGEFIAELTNGPNGLSLRAIGVTGPVTVQRQNNSAAASDLGLLDGAFNSATGALVGQDRATIRVNNLFSDLIDLRDALLTDNSRGITVASESMRANDDRVSAAHALVGSYARRADKAAVELEDRTNLETQMKFQLQNIDFAEAASRLSLLQTQLQASLQVAARSQSRSLLDFIG